MAKLLRIEIYLANNASNASNTSNASNASNASWQASNSEVFFKFLY